GSAIGIGRGAYASFVVSVIWSVETTDPLIRTSTSDVVRLPQRAAAISSISVGRAGSSPSSRRTTAALSPSDHRLSGSAHDKPTSRNGSSIFESLPRESFCPTLRDGAGRDGPKRPLVLASSIVDLRLEHATA